MAPFEIEQDTRPPACIKVIGIGGGGCNAVDGMMANGLANVEFHALNTDAQALSRTRCPNRLQIGADVTGGLGCGGDPLTGEKSANSAKDQIRQILQGADMVFLAAGLGGGTGTGATPVIAQMAKEAGILTVAIVTRPFQFEGPQRMQKAQQGIEKLREYVDTLIVVSNDRLLEVVGSKATLLEAFTMANNVLAQGVQSISDLISVPGLINLDFADVRSIMGERGGAVMGVGVGKGENRAEEAVKKACSSPLLDKIEIDGATGVLICITGPTDLRLSEIGTATTMVYKTADPQANIIFGAVVDQGLTDEVRVTIIATGFVEDLKRQSKKEAEERLTSPTSSVSLRSKLESMLSGKSEKTTAPEPSQPTPPPSPRPAGSPPEAQAPPRPQASGPSDSQTSQAPPLPRFPEFPRRIPGSPIAWEPKIVIEGKPGAALSESEIGVEESEDVDRVAPIFQELDREGEEIDFERISMDARQEVTGNERSSRIADETTETDLETPSYLRKRRDLFE
jgi:cell division protein FtsZ